MHRSAPGSTLIAATALSFVLFSTLSAVSGPVTAPTAATASASASIAPAVPATGSAAPMPTSNEPTGRHTALVANLTLKVVNPKETRKALEQQTRELGGYPVFVTDQRLRLKLPPSHLSALLDAAGKQGLVIEKSLERADLTLEIAKLESQLTSKRSILAELRSFFDGSDVAATLQIEQSMTELVNELEAVKGQLRVLHDRSSWAVVEIAFQFKERQRTSDVTSPFEWLNSVTLPRFLSEF